MEKELSEKDKAFQKTVRDVSEYWEARAEEWAGKERELEEWIPNMEKMDVELSKCLFFQPV